MSRSTLRTTLLLLTIASLWAPAAGAAGRPVTVSPGSSERSITVGEACPTFSWGDASQADSYQLLIFEVPHNGSAPDSEPLHQVTLPGAAGSWTPPLERCLEPGGRYAWAIRALAANGEVGDWSEPAFFRVVAPDPDDSGQAPADSPVAVSTRGHGSRADSELAAATANASGAASAAGGSGAAREATRAPGGALLPSADDTAMTGHSAAASGVAFGVHGISESETDGSAGVVGQSTAANGATAGVVGEVASGAGVAGVFDNLTGGAILSGRTAGIERFRVDGAGNMAASGALAAASANITGTVTGNSFSGDGSQLFGINVDWTDVANRPAGLDDGDQDTVFTVGAGLEIEGNEIQLGGSDLLLDAGTIWTLDSLGFSFNNLQPSATLGLDGLPVVSYLDPINLVLMVAKCNDSVCAGGDETHSIIDASGVTGSSLALGADGLPVISYIDSTNSILKVAKCNDPACTGGDETISTVDDTGQAQWPSIAIGSDGLPTIAYAFGAYPNQSLRVAKCNDSACAGGDEMLTTVDDNGDVGTNASLTLGPGGFPIVAYQDNGNGDLKVASCNDHACAGGDETISTVDGPDIVGNDIAITIGTDGFPIIAYHASTDENLKVAKCNDPHCAGSDEELSIIDDSEIVGFNLSIVIDPNGYPLISYADFGGFSVKVVACDDFACSGGNEEIVVVETAVNSGATSILLTPDELPLLIYGGRDGDVKSTVVGVEGRRIESDEGNAITIAAGDGLSTSGNDDGRDILLDPGNGVGSGADGRVRVLGTLEVSGEVIGDLTGNADSATGLAANGANCAAGLAAGGVDELGAAEECFDVATQAELDSHNAATATQLAADGGDCGDGLAARGVDQVGAAQHCFDVATQAELDSHNAATATQLAADGGDCGDGLAARGVDQVGAAQHCFDVATQAELDSHNAATATQLAADGGDCGDGLAARGVDQVGAAQHCFDVATQDELDSHNAATATQLAADGGDCGDGLAARGVNEVGAAQHCFDVATQAELDSHNAATASQLAANGSNCAAGFAARGVDEAGAAELCFDVATQAELGSHVPYLATRATQLHANGSNCPDGEAARGVGFFGDAEDCFDVATQAELNASYVNVQPGVLTALGESALISNTDGTANTAVGERALGKNLTGSINTAVGQDSLFNNKWGDYNSALGALALYSLLGNETSTDSGSLNTAIGYKALRLTANGHSNVAVGVSALGSQTSGDGNIALGTGAGHALTGGDDNILLGNSGEDGDNGTIRIGDSAHTRTFLAGIHGVTANGGIPVYVKDNGKLGTVTSSRRFKEQIRDLGNLSDRLFDLRPVSFRYRKEVVGDGDRRLELGLIAEEVAEVLPELVVWGDDGLPLTVRYNQLTPMLLNEVIRQERTLRTQSWIIGLLVVGTLALAIRRRRSPAADAPRPAKAGEHPFDPRLAENPGT